MLQKLSALLFLFALSMCAADFRHPFAAVAGTFPGAKAFPDQEQFYVLTLSGLPGNLVVATQDDKKAGLLDITTLTAGGNRRSRQSTSRSATDSAARLGL